jgi:CubicO group peptidase (beta-lactamase class C family)
VIFSGTKGLVALCLLMLVDRGQLELDAPVARYWPEFAAHGKERVRVVEVASHQARLPGIRVPVDEDEDAASERGGGSRSSSCRWRSGSASRSRPSLRAFGPAADAFGHGGAGGSIHCAWPARRVGISYAMNLMSDDEPDPRAQALLAAVYEAPRDLR